MTGVGMLSRDRMPILLAAAFFLTGVFTVLSLPVIGDGAKSVRFLDLLGVVSLLHLARVGLRQPLPAKAWLGFSIFGIGVLLVAMNALQDGDTGRLNIVARLVLSGATGIFLARLATKHTQLTSLAIGLWCGALVACLIAYGQLIGLGSMIALAVVDRVDATIQGTLRPSAIWGHANAAGQSTMAGAAMILVAWKRREGRVLLPLVMYGTIALLNYIVMQNRSPLVVGLLICLLLTVRQPQILWRIAAALFLTGLIAILIFAPGSVFGDRWTGTFSGMTTLDQVFERVRSTVAGVGIAFEAPLGHALADREARMIAETGIRASHNGFVFAALVIGPWLTAFLLSVLVLAMAAAGRAARGRHYALAFGSLGLMLLFEDAIFEPTVTTLIVLLGSLMVLESGARAGTADIGR